MEVHFRYLQFLFSVAKILGQFPTGPASRAWALFMLLLHVVCAQSMFASLFVWWAHFAKFFAGRLSNLLGVLALLSKYGLYLNWLWTAGRFAHAFGELKRLDSARACARRNRNESRRLLFIARLVLSFLLIWAPFALVSTVGLSAAALGPGPKRRRQNALYLREFSEISWLMKYGGLGIGQLYFFMAVHNLISTLAEILTNSCTTHMAGIVTRRLEELTRALDLADQTGKDEKRVHVQDAYAEALHLRAAFLALQRASGSGIVALTATFVLLLTVQAFVVASLFVLPFDGVYKVTFPTLMLLTCVKMWLLVSGGDKLRAAARRFRQTVSTLNAGTADAEIAGGVAAPATTLARLHRIVLGGNDEMKLQLTGCGFFKLNKRMLVQALATVITYNVVIIQFQFAV